ncbi:phage virion morphogenesis protein [Pseudomonas aeruginosa]|nr:phage virion morphogenesis protein [Pseudomonas aeruginosa]
MRRLVFNDRQLVSGTAVQAQHQVRTTRTWPSRAARPAVGHHRRLVLVRVDLTSGARIELEFDSQQVTQALSAAAATRRSPTKILEDLIEPLLDIHQARFVAQRAPDGTPWAALVVASLPGSQEKKQGQDPHCQATCANWRGRPEGDACCSVQTFLMALSTVRRHDPTSGEAEHGLLQDE